MANPIYDSMNTGQTMPKQMQEFMSRLNDFRRGFNGNPRQMVQQMLNTGKISQAQYDRAVQLTNQIQKMIH